MDVIRPHRQTYLKLFKECQYAYYLSVYEDVSVESPKAAYGTMCHRYFELEALAWQQKGDASKALKKIGKVKDKKRKFKQESELKDSLIDFNQIFIDEYPTADLDELEALWRKVKHFSRGGAPERKLMLDIKGARVEESDDAFLSGTIDVVAGNARHIYDYKCGMSGWDFDSQAEMYMCLAREDLHVTGAVFFSFLHPRVLDDIGDYLTRTIQYDAGDIPKIFNSIKKDALMMEMDIESYKDEFDFIRDTQPSKCRRCFVRAECKKRIKERDKNEQTKSKVS